MMRSIALACSLLIAAPLAALAQTAVEVGGVKYEPSVQAGGSTLVLNGAGVRYKLAFKVYAAGLYLGAKAGTPEAVYAANGARRLQVMMLRDIDGNELGKLFTDGMQKNASREEFAKVIPGTIKLGEIFAARKKLVAGDSFAVDFVPGSGTSIVVNGKPASEPIKEPEFFNALMKIWLGPSPADAQLKDALLGMERAQRLGRER